MHFMLYYCLAENEVLRCFATSSALSSLISRGKVITAADMNDEELPGEFLHFDEKLQKIEKYMSNNVWTMLQASGIKKSIMYQHWLVMKIS